MAECNTCQENWLVEVCDLATGIVRDIWFPINMRFDQGLNSVTDGAITLATRAAAMRSLWPGFTSVYISRITGADASRENPVCEFAGIITDIGVSESGTTLVGLKSIEWYLMRRTIRRDMFFTDTNQTTIARLLAEEIHYTVVGLTAIPLYAQNTVSDFNRDRTYYAWSRKLIGEAIVDLTQVIDGPDWELTHARVDGAWSTTMIFRDYLGEDRGITLASDREASAYSISADIESLANSAIGGGTGDGEDQLLVHIYRPSNPYPQFDATPTWNDVSVILTMIQHVSGYLDANQEPDARPTVTLPGLDIEPSLLRVGDTINVDIQYGAINYSGPSRIVTIAWEVGGDKPEMRTLELLPLTPASQSIALRPAEPVNCEDC